MSHFTPPKNLALPAGLNLRSAWRPGDADLIVDLHRRGYASEGDRFGPSFPGYVRKTVEEAGLDAPGHDSRVWFAEQAGETLGCAAMIDRNGRGQLRWVVLLPAARGLGLGKLLLTTAMDYAAAQGWPDVFLETTDGLGPSMQLYLTHGFAVTSVTEVDLWDGPGRMIVMARSLQSG